MAHFERLAASSPLATIMVGASLLLFGRKLFWLFVGVMGFIGGLVLAHNLFQGEPEAVLLAIGLGVGLVGALLTIFLQKLAVSIAGFIAGSYIALEILNRSGGSEFRYGWVLCLIGGALGAVLVAGLFAWALIILSSLLGASFIARGLHLSTSTSSLLLLGLCAVGILFQAGLFGGRSREER